MCFQYYISHALCGHEDKTMASSNPPLTPCVSLDAGGACSGVVYRTRKAAPPTMCGMCEGIYETMMTTFGSGDSEHGDPRLRLLRQMREDRNLGEARKYDELVDRLDVAVRRDMTGWHGPRHGYHLVLIRRAEIFEEFKAWILNQMDKGKVSMTREKVVWYLTRWVVIEIMNHHMDVWEPQEFKRLAQRAFIPWIQQWPLDFGNAQGGDESWEAAREKFSQEWKRAREYLYPEY